MAVTIVVRLAKFWRNPKLHHLGIFTRIITEGNYLLLENEPWRQVHGLLDQAWYLKVNESIRMARLIETYEAHADWVVEV